MALLMNFFSIFQVFFLLPVNRALSLKPFINTCFGTMVMDFELKIFGRTKGTAFKRTPHEENELSLSPRFQIGLCETEKNIVLIFKHI